MPAIEAADVPDLVAGTLRDLGRMKIQQIAQKFQTYQTVGRWFKKDKVQFDEGVGIQRNLMNQLSRQARHVGMSHTVRVDIPQLITQLQINWRHAHVPWAFMYQELLMNKGEAVIFKIIKPRRLDAMLSLAEELEAKAWGFPAAGNKTEPYGIPYWIVTNATTGFNGGAPSGYTTVGGIDLTASPGFKNYTATYTTANKTDLIAKMRTAHRKCRWISPVANDDYRKEEYADYRYYTDDTTIVAFEAIGEGSNENLGRDLAPYGVSNDARYVDGVLLFRKHPIVYVPYLDDTTAFPTTIATNPIYQIDHSTFYPVCLAGDFMRETKPLMLPDQPNVYRVDVWMTYNYLCVDRRRNAVFSK